MARYSKPIVDDEGHNVFLNLMKRISYDSFCRMVPRSGLTPLEQRQLATLFLKLRGR